MVLVNSFRNINKMSCPKAAMPLNQKGTGCPKKIGNTLMNSISSLLWICSVIPNFKSHNIIMSAKSLIFENGK